MKRFILALMLVLLSSFAIHAQDEEPITYTFEDGSVLVFPAGWEISSEADEFGNLSVTRPENQFIDISVPPLDQIEPALEELGIDSENVLEGLLEALTQTADFTLDDGELENAVYGDAEILSFTLQEDEQYLMLVLGQYPTGHLMLFRLNFEGELDPSIIDDVTSIFENAQLAGEITEVEPSTAQDDPVSDDEAPEESPASTISSSDMDMTSYGFLDERVFSVPSDWEYGEKSEESDYFIFIILPVDENSMQVQARLDIPSEELLAQALDEFGVELDELALTTIELLAQDNAVEFDADAMETIEFDRGTVSIFRVLDDEGFYTTWYFALYDNDRIALLNYIGYADFGEGLEEAALAIIDSVQFP